MFITLDFQGLPVGVMRDESLKRNKIKWNFEDCTLKDKFYNEISRQFDLYEIPDFSFCRQGCINVEHWAHMESYWSSFIKCVNNVGLEVFGLNNKRRKIVQSSPVVLATVEFLSKFVLCIVFY